MIETAKPARAGVKRSRPKASASDKLATLETALEHLNQGFCIFDREHRLVLCNARYAQMYELPAELARPGTMLRRILEHRFEIGLRPLDDREACIARWTEGARAMQPSKAMVGFNDGRILCRDHRPLQDGGFVSIFEDVTEGLNTATELDRTKNLLKRIIDGIPSVILVKDVRERRYVVANRGAELHFGRGNGEIIGRRVADLYPPQHADRIARDDEMVLRLGSRGLSGSYAIKTPSGATRQFSSHHMVIPDQNGQPGHILLVLEDRTDRLRTEAERDSARNFLNAVIENIPMPVFVKDARAARYLVVNRAAEAMAGASRAQMLGKTTIELHGTQEAVAVAGRDAEAMACRGQVVAHEIELVAPDGDTRSIISKRLTIDSAAGEPEFIIVVNEDVTEQRRAAERIAFMAHHDPLTGLPNRVAFTEKLDASFVEARRAEESFAVLCIDMDRFKEVNDVFGHATGDTFLQVVARRLQAVADDAFVARLGGDEFTMISRVGPQPATAVDLVQRLLTSVCGDVRVDGHQMRISLSVGISIYPNDGADASTLLSNADAALYRAKREGRDTHRFFDKDMDRRTRERHALLHDLRLGIARRELMLHYQPQAKLRGEIVGFEALIRWMHPKRGMIPPGNFIPAAEENGLIVEIGEWTLREACREAASWDTPLQIALNLSPVQFRYGDLPSLVHRVLLETGLRPDRLELEITESALIGDFSRALSILRRLKTLGVKIAMDDFGTGYSSLSYLQAFPFDKIKIDRSFIMNLRVNPQSATIVRAVIGLARGLDLPVIAEGVETEDQLAFLTDEACDEVQGFLIGRPRPIDDYSTLVGTSQGMMRKALLVG